MRRKSYILTETAERDFRAARRWSLDRWGAKQTKSYFQRLHGGAVYIAEHQSAISSRDDLSEDSDLGVYPVGEHYIVYARLDEDQIAIVALVRQTRDVPAILQANGFQIRRALEAAINSWRARHRK